MELTVKRFVTGPIETNTYVLSQDDGLCIIFDPSSGCCKMLDYIKNNSLSPEAICLTHCHFDHFMGIEEVIKEYPGIAVWAYPDEKPMLLNPEYNGSHMMGIMVTYKGPLKELHEGDIQIGSFRFTVLHVPGHSPGGCAFVIEKHCFSGDTLFAGSVGRFDFPGCDGALLFKNIKEKLFTLPDETIVHSGHGGRTTVGREKRYNPFFK